MGLYLGGWDLQWPAGRDQRLCALVVIGVNSQGEKQLLAIEDGVRESTQSWRELAASQSPGDERPRIGHWRWRDGLLGGCGGNLSDHAPAAVLGAQNEQLLNALPKSGQPKAKQALQEIWRAETKTAATRAFDCFLRTNEAKYPKATACLEKDREELLTFYAFPASHWQVFAPRIQLNRFGIRHRTKRTKGCLLGMAYYILFKLGRKWIQGVGKSYQHSMY